MFKKIWRAYTIARTAEALSRLSDAQLEDIGVPRDRIYDRARAIHGAER